MTAGHTESATTHLAEIDLVDQDSGSPVGAPSNAALSTHSPVTSAGRQTDRGGSWLVWLGGSCALLWIGGAFAYLWGVLGVQSLSAIALLGFGQLAGLSAFAILPALFFLLGGFMARELVRSGNASARMELAIERLAAPDRQAQAEVRSLADAVIGEVDRINAAMESALARLAAMEEVISHHAETLEQTAGDATDRTETMLTGLRRERLRLTEVSESLDDKAALIAAAISDQSKMVAAAAELAASQTADTEKRIHASVETLDHAGDQMAERGDIVANKIAERSTHLREMSDTLKTRAEGLDTAYSKHQAKLAEASENLRQEQERIAAALDFHRAELDVMAKTARDGAEALNSATTDGASAFTEAVDQALDRARGMAGEVRRETDYAAREHEAGLARLIASAQEAKEISDASIDAVRAQAELIADKVEKTNQTAFEAAQRSDETFEQRLAEAEKLTTRASRAADDAAESVKRRLEAVVASARAETQTIERQLEQMSEKLESMPELARQQAQETTDALRRGLEGLNAAAVAAAEEAQEIDAGFQSRIRQNYELLSDFMLRMGTVAGGRRAPNLGSNEIPAPILRGVHDPDTPAADSANTAVPGSEEMNAPLSGGGEAEHSDTPVGFPERDRRRSTDPGWRWKDLLSSMPASDDDRSND